MIATSTCSYFNPATIQEKPLTYQFASSTCQTDFGFLASTTPATYNGFTTGEILMSFFLFLIFLFSIFQFFIFKFLGAKIHKEV